MTFYSTCTFCMNSVKWDLVNTIEAFIQKMTIYSAFVSSQKTLVSLTIWFSAQTAWAQEQTHAWFQQCILMAIVSLSLSLSLSRKGVTVPQPCNACGFIQMREREQEMEETCNSLLTPSQARPGYYATQTFPTTTREKALTRKKDSAIKCLPSSTSSLRRNAALLN